MAGGSWGWRSGSLRWLELQAGSSGQWGRRGKGHLEGSGLGSQAKMLPMLAAKMMARMMQHIMIMIFFCTGREGR